MKSIIFVASVLVGLVFAQVEVNSDCGELSDVKNFNSAKFLGVWHEIKRYKSSDNNIACVAINITKSPDLLISETYKILPNKTLLTYNLTRNQNKILGAPFIGHDGYTMDPKVLSTDYENFALVSSCELTEKQWIRKFHLCVVLIFSCNFTWSFI